MIVRLTKLLQVPLQPSCVALSGIGPLHQVIKYCNRSHEAGLAWPLSQVCGLVAMAGVDSSLGSVAVTVRCMAFMGRLRPIARTHC